MDGWTYTSHSLKYFTFLDRTKRRRIAAKVAEHFHQVSLETEFDQEKDQEDFTNGECVYDDCAHNVGDNVFEEPVDSFGH